MASYRHRLQLHATAQEPKMTLRLNNGEDTLQAAVKLVETLCLQQRETTGDTPDKEEKA